MCVNICPRVPLVLVGPVRVGLVLVGLVLGSLDRIGLDHIGLDLVVGPDHVLPLHLALGLLQDVTNDVDWRGIWSRNLLVECSWR